MEHDLFQAAQWIQGNENAKKVFRLVADQLGLSGWALAKNLDLDPSDTEKILHKLTDSGVFRSRDRGLSGNYSLTGLEFSLKENLSGSFNRG